MKNKSALVKQSYLGGIPAKTRISLGVPFLLTNKVEQAHDISEPHLKQLLCDLELRQLEEARTARPPALEPVHNEDPGSVSAQARYKLNFVSIRGRGRSGDPEISVITSGNR